MNVKKLFLTAVMLAAVTVGVLAKPDMRINIGTDAVLFRENGGIQIWTPAGDDVWEPSITLSADEVLAYADATPEKATVIATAGDVTLTLLANGQWEVVNGPDAEGKISVAVFESDFSYAFEHNWSVYDL